MTIRDLREALVGLADETPVLAPARDHGYRDVTARATTALYASHAREWTEDHGEELTPEATWGKRRTVLVIE